MKCAACGKSYPISQWKTVNLNTSVTKTTIRDKTQSLVNKKPISYYTVPGKIMYNNIYCCPYCGTLRVLIPTNTIK